MPRVAFPASLHAFRALSTAIGMALTLSACSVWRPAKVPMDTRLEKSTCTSNARTLLVMMPGAYSRPEEFVREGFPAAVRERRLAVDVLLADAHIGYFNNKTIFERLHDDVMAPARAQGYTSIWMLGISIGGLGALGYSATHPGEVSGIVALAPYLGERLTSTEISNAGGLKEWKAPPGPLAADQLDLRLWTWLKRYGTQAGSPDLPPLYLGYGVDDRFAFSHALLAKVLPPDRVATTAGGHDWPPWDRLWQDILPRLPLPNCPL